MAKGNRDLMLLKSTGLNKKGQKTGYFKVISKNRRTTQGKIKRKCYDPRAWNKESQKVGMHVEFVEGGKA